MGSFIPAIRRAFRGATSGAAGLKGLVPQPVAGDQTKLLHGDGTWKTVTNASAATNAEAATGTDTAKFLTPAARRYAEAFARNALAPRGGVSLDGTTSARVVSTLTGQNIGTDPFSLSVFLKPATTAQSSNDVYAFMGSSASFGGAADGYFIVRGESGGQLRILITGVTFASDYNRWTLSNWYTNYGGKEVHLVVVRNSSGNPTIYVNGVDVTSAGSFDSGGSAPTWQGTVTSTYCGFGAAGASPVFGAFKAFSLYNLALSAADVLEIYELGGAVPYRYQFGSQAEIVTNGDFASATGWTAQAGWAISGGVAAATAAATDKYLYRAPAATAKLLKKYRLTFTVSGYVAGGVRPYITTSSVSGGSLGTVRSANGTYTEELTASLDNQEIGLISNGASTTLNVDNFTAKQIGAVVHLPLNDGIGYQLHDESTNKLDAVMTATGVSHLIPQRRGYVRGTLTWAGTHEGKSLIGQQCYPSGAVIELITTTATAASTGSGATHGTTNSANRWSTAQTYSTPKNIATLSSRVPAGTAAADLDHVVDPDTNNYTGSIQVESRYTITEGTP